MMDPRSLGSRLRDRVTIESRETLRDSNGLAYSDWTAVVTDEPAEVLTGAGKDAVANGQPATTVSARVTVRWRPSLASPEDMRVLVDGSAHYVQTYYTDATRRRWLTLVCEQGARDD